MKDKRTSSTKQVETTVVNSAEKHIREQLSKTKKLSIKERETVARNVSKILERAKSEGVKTQEIATRMNLGQGEAKELYPYYLPSNRNQRRLNAKPQGYLNLIEALAGIDGHSRTGATSDLLREAFSDTKYWNRGSAEEDVVVDLHALITKCEEWILRDGQVAEAYRRLIRLSRPQESLRREEDTALTIYRKAFEYPKSFSDLKLEPIRLHIGTVYSPIRNLSKEHFCIKSEGSKVSTDGLWHGREFFLYLGPAPCGSIKFQVAEEKTLTVGNGAPFNNRRVEYIDDRFENDGIIIQTFDGETIDFIGKEYRDTIGEPSQILAGGRMGCLTRAFIEKHPAVKEFGYEYGMLERVNEVKLHPLSMDFLDHLRETFSVNGCDYLSPDVESVLQPDMQLRYGTCRLTQLMTFFIYPWISELHINRYELAASLGVLEKCRPDHGWIHADGHTDDPEEESYWSIPDVMWLQAKLFCSIIEIGYEEGSKSATHRLESTISKFSNA